MIDADPTLVVALQIFGHQNGTCLGLGELRSVVGVAEEAQLLPACFRQGSDGCDRALPITCIMTANEINKDLRPAPQPSSPPPAAGGTAAAEPSKTSTSADGDATKDAKR